MTEESDTMPGVDLEVVALIEETEAARSIVLEPPAAGAHLFGYKPGQFLTLRVPIPGAPVARCYSLSSVEGLDDRLKVTVKKIEGGAGSSWLVDQVKVGDVIRSLRPAGTFTPRTLDAHVFLFAAGSGITPIIAIARSALAHSDSSIHLFYANRDPATTIFRKEIAALATQYPNRFTIRWWHEEAEDRLPMVADIGQFIAGEVEGQYFTCGPTPFMTIVMAGLRDSGVEEERVHCERFETDAVDPFAPPTLDSVKAEPTSTSVSSLEVTLDGVTSVLEWPAGRVLLDVMLDADLAAPYSCREGNCSACACFLLAGRVEMESNDVLDAADLEEGLILGCQSRPTTAAVKVSFDE